MPRKEFSRKTRAQAFERCGGHCEGCGAKLKVGEAEYDHTLPDALGGDNSLENCTVFCSVCHKPKTKQDIQRIRKADRVRDKHTNAVKPSSRPLPGGKKSKWKRKMNGEVVRRD